MMVRPTASKKAKCDAPPPPAASAAPNTMLPPSGTPIKKAKTEAGPDAMYAVKGACAGRPPATPQTSARVAPSAPQPPVKGSAMVVKPPPAPKAELPKPAPPAYVKAPCVPPPVGVKMELTPVPSAAAALRMKKPRPSMKVETTTEMPTSGLVAPVGPAPPISPSLANSEKNSATNNAEHRPLVAKAAPLPKPPPPVANDKDPQAKEREREESIRTWIQKMDPLETQQRIEKIRKDPVFPQYQEYLRKEIFDGDEPDEFGTTEEDEEMVQWYLWLENQLPKPLPDPNPAETAQVAVRAPVEPKRVTFLHEVTVHTPAASPASPASTALYVPTAPTACAIPTPPAEAAPAPPAKTTPSVATPPAETTPADAPPAAETPPATESRVPVPKSSLEAATPTGAVPISSPGPTPALPPSSSAPSGILATNIVVNAPADAEVTFSSYKERQAHYAQMRRQLENFEQFEIPDQIVESWKQACVSRSRAGKNAVFQAFLRCGKDWSKLEVKSSKSRRDRTVGRRRYGWKTKAQLMAMHNDEQIVSRIIDTKTRQQEYKEHPDAPGDINAMMFYVLVDLENVEEDEYEEEVRLDVSGEAYGEQAERLASDPVLNGMGSGVMHEPLRLQLPPPKQELAVPGAPTTSAAAPAGVGTVPGTVEAGAKPKASRRPKAAGVGHEKAPPSRNEMPEELRPKALWILNKLSGDLQNARMWPVHLAHLKHQESLCKSFRGHADELERSFLQLTKQTMNKEIDPADVNQLKAACELALQRMALYHEDATEASTLTKPSRGSKEKKIASRPAK